MNYEEMSIELLAELFSKYKAELDQEEKVYKDKQKGLKSYLSDIQNQLHIKMQDADIKNIKSNLGLVYFNTRTFVTRSNKENFLKFLRLSNRWDLVNPEPYREGVKKYVEETGMIPDGVNYEVTKELMFRKG